MYRTANTYSFVTTGEHKTDNLNKYLQDTLGALKVPRVDQLYTCHLRRPINPPHLPPPHLPLTQQLSLFNSLPPSSLHSNPNVASIMADVRGEHRLTAARPGEGMKNLLPDKGPSASQALTVATLFPLGGFLLTLSGLALAASVVGLVLATPVFLLFSPVLVPAALLMALAVTGFLTSGVLGLGGLSSLTSLANTVRGLFQGTPDYVEQAKRRMAEAAAQAGQKTKDSGEMIQSKAQQAAGRT